MPHILREISPEELGEYPPGHSKYDPDLHFKKFRCISVDMQKEEEIAEKMLYNEFVDEPVKEPQERLLFLIPKNNLRIPFKWFDYESDAAVFIKSFAKANNVSVHCLGKSTMSTGLRIFLDTVWDLRDLRTKQKDDPPRISLQERRIRHWKAVIDKTCLARGFSLRLVRHVTLMLAGASLDFANSNGQRSKNSDLSSNIERICTWFEQYDPDDLEAFEGLQPKRQDLHKPNAHLRPQSRRRRWANDSEKGKGNRNGRKRKTDTYRPSYDGRQKRQCLLPLPLPQPRPDREIELPERITESKGGRRDWGERA